MPERKRFNRIKAVLGKDAIPYCQVCGYKEYSEILTYHHKFPKEKYPNQSILGLPRKERFLVVCPNCHAKINKGILFIDVKNSEAIGK